MQRLGAEPLVTKLTSPSGGTQIIPHDMAFPRATLSHGLAAFLRHTGIRHPVFGTLVRVAPLYLKYDLAEVLIATIRAV